MNKNSRAALGRRAGRVELLSAVLLALSGGLIVAAVAYGFLRWITPIDTSKAAAEIDVTRMALTVVAGVGGVVALVITYRRQRDLEQSRFVERFGAAAAQLGATDVAVRMAGVYAMAGVADESDGQRRQQCIEVLCGYLRLPYSPEFGGNHQSKLVVMQHRASADGTHADNHEHHYDYRQNDREVRKTIIRVIADHLRPEAEYSWSTSNFDFRTAHLDDVDFTDAVFYGTARFDEVVFSGDTRFDHVTFNGDTWFDHVTFDGDTRFRRATFGSAALFRRTTFSGTAGFDQALFSGDAGFGHATFGSEAWFDQALFSGDAGFGHATFGSEAWFDQALFNGDTLFDHATFNGDAWFRQVTFNGDTRFQQAAFGSDTRFNQVSFTGSTSFVATDFGSGRVVFVGPRQWGPPVPRFDWGEDGVGKPPNVEPRDWPPARAQT
ncbi:pentapeptide repeat-containing protein [Nocardia sp. NPDC050793]|uniref:pentapeptide repeat-containing protein n=1 Tax=Nocardia sp. NPDC050793 TaxID=3155159 RepID=UPI0033DFE098